MNNSLMYDDSEYIVHAIIEFVVMEIRLKMFLTEATVTDL